MKKVMISLFAMFIVASVSYGAEYRNDVEMTITSSTNSAVATYTVPGAGSAKNVRVYPYALYQTVASGVTNTVTLKVIPYGESNEYTVDTLAAVSNASTLETFGVGDVTADVDPIVLLPGDQLKLDGTGTASSNVTYRLRLMQEVD